METILTALVALVVVIGLIVVGIRISVYLFLEHVEGTRRFTHALPMAHERLRSDTINTVKRPRHHHIVDTGHSSARYALHSFMVIAFILLLTMVAAVSILLGKVH